MKGDIITNRMDSLSQFRKGLIGGLLLLAALFALMTGCSKSSNQASAGFEQSVQIAKEADSAIAALDWPLYASLVYPPDLQNFHDMLMPGIEAHPSPTNADSVDLFGTAYSIDSLRNENPAKFFEEIMNLVVKLSPQLGQTFSSMTNDHLGGVPDGDSLVHIVSRTEFHVGNQSINEMNVVTTRQYEGSWKVLLSPKIQGVAQMVQQGLAQRMPTQPPPQQRPPQKP